MGLDDKVVVVTGGCDLRPAFLHQRRNPCVSLSLQVGFYNFSQRVGASG